MRVMDFMARMTKYLSVNTHAKNSNGSNESGSSLGSTCKVQVRLPKIELPTFDGDILCWQSYYQSVKVSIVDNSALADVQKLEYIMRSLKGVAAEFYYYTILDTPNWSFQDLITNMKFYIYKSI